MPRARTPEERERVVERLHATGKDLFQRLGLARVTVEDLARGAGIGKGSLYHFYATKEDLFFAIQEREEAAFRESLVGDLEAAEDPEEAVHALLASVSGRLERHPFLRLLLDPATMNALLLRLPEARIEAHRRADEAFFVDLAKRWKRAGWLRPEVTPRVFVDVLTAMFVLSSQGSWIGADTMRRATDEIARAVAVRWTREPTPTRPRRG